MKLFAGIALSVIGLIPGAATFCQTTTYVIDPANTAQTISNIGASGCWFSENIGRYWPDKKKERMAELLFSKQFDKGGNPLGIGLSAWRFNIGGGTAEQGDSSGISTAEKRVECFLSPDGSYDWSKQQGYVWFLKKAHDYGVENLIAFSNTPPVQFTKNGLGFRTAKDYQTNLREDAYHGYANFLATVIEHFDKENLHFSYISPVNEPQWDWSAQFGKMNQEGSPWHNENIYKIDVSLDSALTAKNLGTKILGPEAGILTALYEGKGHASRQIQNLYDPASKMFIGNLPHAMPVIAGHSYFTDNGDTTIVQVRSRLRDTAARYGIGFWQSEYCMLGNGYKEKATGEIPAIDCALFLAKMIHNDLVVANAGAWQLWNAWEPGKADHDTRYYLLALKPGATNATSDFAITKNLWALGQYSRFIRPGMRRIITSSKPAMSDIQAAKDVMLSAFTDGKKIVVVAINYTASDKTITLQLPAGYQQKNIHRYLTSATADMQPQQLKSVREMVLPSRSVSTVVIE